MPPFFEAVLPTKLSRYLLAGSAPIGSVFFAFPSYLPSELWAIQSLNILQARLLMAGLVVLLCIIGSFVSIVIHHKKVAFELSEIKEYMSVEQMLEFQKRLNEIQRTNR